MARTDTHSLPEKLMRQFRFLLGVETDVGMRREENQDAYGYARTKQANLFIVADGMGGARGGARASAWAINVIGRAAIDAGGVITEDSLAAAAERANTVIFEESRSNENYSGMGTTVVALGLVGSHAITLNVGDSRIYFFRDGNIQQLTRDHTLVQDLVESGAISPEQAENHPIAHMLTRSLGPAGAIQADIATLDITVQEGDRFLLCCDGLYNHVNDPDINRIVSSNEPADAAQALVDLANQRGGSDNITVEVVEVHEPNSDAVQEDELEEGVVELRMSRELKDFDSADFLGDMVEVVEIPTKRPPIDPAAATANPEPPKPPPEPQAPANSFAKEMRDRNTGAAFDNIIFGQPPRVTVELKKSEIDEIRALAKAAEEAAVATPETPVTPHGADLTPPPIPDTEKPTLELEDAVVEARAILEQADLLKAAQAQEVEDAQLTEKTPVEEDLETSEPEIVDAAVTEPEVEDVVVEEVLEDEIDDTQTSLTATEPPPLAEDVEPAVAALASSRRGFEIRPLYAVAIAVTFFGLGVLLIPSKTVRPGDTATLVKGDTSSSEQKGALAVVEDSERDKLVKRMMEFDPDVAGSEGIDTPPEPVKKPIAKAAEDTGWPTVEVMPGKVPAVESEAKRKAQQEREARQAQQAADEIAEQRTRERAAKEAEELQIQKEQERRAKEQAAEKIRFEKQVAEEKAAQERALVAQKRAEEKATREREVAKKAAAEAKAREELVAQKAAEEKARKQLVAKKVAEEKAQKALLAKQAAEEKARKAQLAKKKAADEKARLAKKKAADDKVRRERERVAKKAAEDRAKRQLAAKKAANAKAEKERLAKQLAEKAKQDEARASKVAREIAAASALGVGPAPELPPAATVKKPAAKVDWENEKKAISEIKRDQKSSTKATILASEEKRAIIDRKTGLRERIANIDAKLRSFNVRSKKDAKQKQAQIEEQLTIVGDAFKETKNNLATARRRLDLWKSRKEVLQTKDPLSIADKVAVSSVQVKRRKEQYNIANLRYNDAVEQWRENPSDDEASSRMASLGREQKARKAELDAAVRSSVSSSVKQAEFDVSEFGLLVQDLERRSARLNRQIGITSGTVVTGKGDRMASQRRLLDERRSLKVELDKLKKQVTDADEVKFRRSKVLGGN